MHPSDVASVSIAVIAGIGLIGAIVNWFFKRGGDERAFAVALRDCADAVRALTAEFRGFRDTVMGELHGLDKRVTILEEASKNDSPSPHRDPGSD